MYVEVVNAEPRGCDGAVVKRAVCVRTRRRPFALRTADTAEDYLTPFVAQETGFFRKRIHIDLLETSVTEAESNETIDYCAICVANAHWTGEYVVVDRNAQKSEASHQKAGNRA